MGDDAMPDDHGARPRRRDVAPRAEAVTEAAEGRASDRERVSSDTDAAYEAYDEHPLSEPDAWGDVASFREANNALNEAIRRRAASIDLAAEFEARGQAYAELDDEGNVVVRRPEGTSEQ